MPTKKDIAGFKTGNKEIQNFVSVYKNPIVFFVGNSPSYFYWVNPQPKWFLLPISGRMMHNKLDEPTEKQCINMCKYITSKIKPDISNIIVVDKSNGDSIQGVITFLKSKCKLNKPINFLNTWDIQGIEETIEKIRLQLFV